MINFFLFCFVNFLSVASVPENAPAVIHQPIVDTVRQELIADKLDSLFHILSAHRGFNGNVLISQNGRVLYKNSFGYSDLKKKTPLELRSSFQLASVTKQFTSMAIMMLHDEGKLDFSDTLTKFYPDFPYRNVTIKQLLTHTAGLPEYTWFAGKYWKGKKSFMRNCDIMDMLIAHHPAPIFKAGKKYRYSNTGYVVLASLVEKITGTSYGDFLSARVFRPLGMVGSYVSTPDGAPEGILETKGHRKSKRQLGGDVYCGVVGDKGIFSTVEDMFQWDQALYTDQLVSPATLEEAFTPFVYDRKRHSQYGYGWRINSLDDGSKIVYHAGLWHGYNSLFVRHLSDRTAIVVLSNKVNWSFRNIDRLMGIINLGDYEQSSVGGE